MGNNVTVTMKWVMEEEYLINTCNICHIIWNILDVLHYLVSTPFYFFDYNVINCNAIRAWEGYLQNSTTLALHH